MCKYMYVCVHLRLVKDFSNSLPESNTGMKLKLTSVDELQSPLEACDCKTWLTSHFPYRRIVVLTANIIIQLGCQDFAAMSL